MFSDFRAGGLAY